MTGMDIVRALGRIDSRYIAEVEPTVGGERILDISEDVRPVRRNAPRRGRALWVLAAVLLLLVALSAVAVAANFFGLRDLLLPREPENPDSVQTGESLPQDSGMQLISLSGYMDSPGAKALAEWEAFRDGYDPDGSIARAVDAGEVEGVDSLYGAYTPEMLTELERIADKYGLTFHQEMNIIDQEETAYRVGGEFFLGDNLSRAYAYIYDDGTFQFDGDYYGTGRSSGGFQLRRVVKGVFDEVVLNIGDVADYTQWQYTTPGGEPLLLALSGSKGLIFGDFPDCFLTVNVLPDGQDELTREGLEAIADGIDFTLLKNVVKPDMRGDSIPGEMSDSGDGDGGAAEVPQAPTVPAAPASSAAEAYRAVLRQLHDEQTLPDFLPGFLIEWDREFEWYNIEDNLFAVGDFDGDGETELLISYTTCSTAGMFSMMYRYNGDTGLVEREFLEAPTLTIFDGYILADLLHNHSLGPEADVWPYTLYVYNAAADSYDVAAEVSAWQRSFYETDWEGNPFPEDVDQDGDGVVYLLSRDDRREIIDGPAYEAWRESTFAASGAMEVSWMNLTEENIAALTVS